MCLSWIRSSIGKKTLMALSGLALSLFVVVHLAGNLLIYRGPAALNAYAAKLDHLGIWLWVARAGLIAAVIVHIITSIQLTLENQRARPQPYAVYRADTRGSLPMGNCHHSSRFAFVSLPHSWAMGRVIYMLNEGNSIFRRTLTGAAWKSGTMSPGLEGVLDEYQNWPSDDSLKTRWGKP